MPVSGRLVDMDFCKKIRKFEGTCYIPGDQLATMARYYRGANLNLNLTLQEDDFKHMEGMKSCYCPDRGYIGRENPRGYDDDYWYEFPARKKKGPWLTRRAGHFPAVGYLPQTTDKSTNTRTFPTRSRSYGRRAERARFTKPKKLVKGKRKKAVESQSEPDACCEGENVRKIFFYDCTRIPRVKSKEAQKFCAPRVDLSSSSDEGCPETIDGEHTKCSCCFCGEKSPSKRKCSPRALDRAQEKQANQEGANAQTPFKRGSGATPQQVQNGDELQKPKESQKPNNEAVEKVMVCLPRIQSTLEELLQKLTKNPEAQNGGLVHHRIYAPKAHQSDSVYPLPHQYVIKDLVVDMSNFYDQYKAIRPYLIRECKEPVGRRQLKQSIRDRAKLSLRLCPTNGPTTGAGCLATLPPALRL
ncbi:unnamed protein product [Nesidiocoris tenuis]|uniref:Uncharacterized protein n=1 Tax=Nesidiocoris tenuis TaxID=355587 RepID=A0A6H5HMI8_9HEMI|nr:unnamed protein product [Nesidiocoris tenuis]